MKMISRPSLYFSAYPLKAFLQATSAEEERSPFLKSLLTGKTRSMSRIRVAPMLNPYKNEDTQPAAPEKKEKKSKEVEPTGEDWYKDYE